METIETNKEKTNNIVKDCLDHAFEKTITPHITSYKLLMRELSMRMREYDAQKNDKGFDKKKFAVDMLDWLLSARKDGDRLKELLEIELDTFLVRYKGLCENPTTYGFDRKEFIENEAIELLKHFNTYL